MTNLRLPVFLFDSHSFINDIDRLTIIHHINNNHNHRCNSNNINVYLLEKFYLFDELLLCEVGCWLLDPVALPLPIGVVVGAPVALGVVGVDVGVVAAAVLFADIAEL